MPDERPDRSWTCDSRAIHRECRILSPLRIAAILLLCLALLPPRLLAAEGPVSLHVPINEAPPYRIIAHKSGAVEFSGIYVDIARAMAARAGAALSFEPVPYARAFAMMQNGEGDLMLGPNRTPAREAYLHYLEPALPAEPKAFVLRAASPDIADYDSLRGLRIATLRGAHYTAAFDADGSLVRVPVVDYETALRMLEGGRVDTAIMPEMRARWMLRGQAGLRLAAFRIPGDLSYIAMARRSPHISLAPQFEAALRQMRDAGEIARILALYS
jgi:polar amino acid transport system substrate-binding protein